MKPDFNNNNHYGFLNSSNNPQRMNNEDKERIEQQKREYDEKKRVMLRNVLSVEAQERLKRIALVKPEKAQKAENIILQQIQMSGGITNKLSEAALISILETIDKFSASPVPTVKIQRRKGFDDDDDF